MVIDICVKYPGVELESGGLVYYIHTVENRNEQSNKQGDKAHLRIIAPLPSGANIAKTKSATGNIYASTSRTVGAPRPRAQRS